MKFSDPYRLPPDRKQDAILFAGSQVQGKKNLQEDFFTNFNDECFAIADGVGSLPHADIAARLVCETAIWAYKHVRQRPYYWSEKTKLLKRIFRTTNLTLWQKRRDSGFSDGLASALTVLLVSPSHLWVGSAGNCSAYLFRDGLIDQLTNVDIDGDGMLTKALGFTRLGLVPQVVSEQFLQHDVLLIATDGVVNFLEEDELRAIIQGMGNTVQSLSDAVVTIIQTAQKNGSDDNMTACLVKRVPVT